MTEELEFVVQADWEPYLESRFPGYLLPSSEKAAVSLQAARQFLRHFRPNVPDELSLVCSASLMTDVDKRADLQALVDGLPGLLRRLPSTAIVERRKWSGGFQGRLNISETLTAHGRGERLTYITSARRRSFAMPETELLAVTLGRLRKRLKLLQTHGLLASSDNSARWSAGLGELLVNIEMTLLKSPLGALQDTVIDAHHERAARESRDDVYRRASRWFNWLRAIDESDESRAHHLVRGALLPIDPETRFHIAVLLRLVQSFEEILGAGWRMERSAIIQNRKDVVAFHRGDDARIRIYHEKVVLPFNEELGERDKGVKHFLASSGRLRPDITVVLERPNGERSGFVIEVKYTLKPSYVATGFGEALLYRSEYRRDLLAMPKSAVVAPAGVPGLPRDADEVIAVEWNKWPPRKTLERLVSWLQEPAIGEAS